MFLRYGNYTHESAEASISISRNQSFGEFGQAVSFTETWQITGRLRDKDDDRDDYQIGNENESH